jgi:hypothetical protein
MKTTRKPRYAELTATRLLGEQRWAYERHLEHMNYRDMRRLVIEPVDRGGLGYDLSEHALRGLVVGYVESARETLTEERGVYIARELADLDLQHRALAAVLARSIDAAESTKVAAALGYDSLAQLLKEAPDAAVPLDARQITALLRELRAVGESRRKLLGLDAPLEARVEVTSRDGVMAELEAMLAGNDDLSTKRKAKR